MPELLGNSISKNNKSRESFLRNSLTELMLVN